MFKAEDRTALAEMLVEVIKPNHLTGDMVSLFLKTRALKPGDSLVKKIRNIPPNQGQLAFRARLLLAG